MENSLFLIWFNSCAAELGDRSTGVKYCLGIYELKWSQYYQTTRTKIGKNRQILVGYNI